MLTITVPETESFNEDTSEFATVELSLTLDLEHSLVSLSKWEEKYQKPFLSQDEKTPDEVLGYVEAMILTPAYPKNIVQRLTRENVAAINAYIESSQSATTIRDLPRPSRGRPEIVTSELIYYWMTAFSIPPVHETWHLNRLFNLIRIANIKNSKQSQKGSKMTQTERSKLNEERKREFSTTG